MGMDQQCTATAVTLWQQAQGTLVGIWRYLAIRYVNNDPDHP